MGRPAILVLLVSAVVPPLLGNAVVLLAPTTVGAGLLVACAWLLAAASWWAVGALARVAVIDVALPTVRWVGAARVGSATLGAVALAAPALAPTAIFMAVPVDVVFWSVVLLGARRPGTWLPALAAVVYTVSRTSAAAVVALGDEATREPFLLVHRFGAVVAAGLIALALVRLARAGAVDTGGEAQKDVDAEAR